MQPICACHYCLTAAATDATATALRFDALTDAVTSVVVVVDVRNAPTLIGCCSPAPGSTDRLLVDVDQVVRSNRIESELVCREPIDIGTARRNDDDDYLPSREIGGAQ
jgi:hypothetical protein